MKKNKKLKKLFKVIFKKALQKIRNGEIILTLLLMLQQYVLIKFVETCRDSLIHFAIMYLCVLIFGVLQKYQYVEDLDKITFRRIKWDTAAITLTFIYALINNPILSKLVDMYISICEVLLFSGQNGQALTWEEIQQIIEYYKNFIELTLK